MNRGPFTSNELLLLLQCVQDRLEGMEDHARWGKGPSFEQETDALAHMTEKLRDLLGFLVRYNGRNFKADLEALIALTVQDHITFGTDHARNASDIAYWLAKEENTLDTSLSAARVNRRYLWAEALASALRKHFSE